METGRRTRKKIIRNGAKTINPTTVVGDLIIIRNGAKTICPQHFVFGDIIKKKNNKKRDKNNKSPDELRSGDLIRET